MSTMYRNALKKLHLALLLVLLLSIYGCDGASGDDDDDDDYTTGITCPTASVGIGQCNTFCPTSNPTVGYCEPVPEMVDVSDLSSSYSTGVAVDHGITFWERRYPHGVWLTNELNDGRGDLDYWLGRVGYSDWNDFMRALGVALHEMGHMLDFQKFEETNFTEHVFCLRSDLCMPLPDDIETFYFCEVSTLVPAENRSHYFDTYIQDSQMCSQAFAVLLDELTQYGHSLYIAVQQVDQMQPGYATGDRDGLLNMMYFVGTYLLVAKQDHPSVYDAITSSNEYRHVISTLWGRAETALAFSEEYKERLGIDDDAMEINVYSNEIIDEIRALIPTGTMGGSDYDPNDPPF